MSNPYTLVFGQPPVELIERGPQAERIISEFCSDRPSNYINLVTGIRGSGKTVFITEVADRIGKKEDWIVVNLNPQRNLLTSLAAKLNSNRKLSKIFNGADINLEFLGIGIGIDTSQPITDVEEALSRMLHSLQKHGKRVLVTIDEVTNCKDMRIFASAYQIFLREKLPIFLLMSGLYKNIAGLKNAEGMTFLERSPRTVLGPLNFELMTEKYMKTLNVDQSTATLLARQTKGYSFAFQTIGYFFWENPSDMDTALKKAQDYLSEFSYQKIWSELSRKDREVVLAVSRAPTGRISDVREVLHYSTNQFNPYRDRLIKSGVLTSSENGFIELALPFFGDYAEKTARDSTIL